MKTAENATRFLSRLQFKDVSINTKAIRGSAAANCFDGADERGAAQGFILPITLFMLTVIALLITGMLSSISLEQRLAANRLLRVQSRTIAESGLEAGLQLVRTQMTASPAHAVGYVPEHQDLIENLGLSSDAVRPVMLVVDLASGEEVEIPLRSTAPAAAPEQWIDMNEQLKHGMRFDAIPQMPAGWVEFPVQAGSPAERAGLRYRYAFFVDDESSRLNYAVAGNADGPSGEFVRGNRGGARNLDIGVLPWFGGEGWSDRPDAGEINQDFLDFRNRMPLPELAFPNRFPRFSSSPYPLLVGYSGTTFSLSNRLTSSGHQRANLQAIFGGLEQETPDILEALETFREVINRRLPDFAERFQPGPPSSSDSRAADYKRRYLDTLGVNLIDQIDSDQEPTWLGTQDSSLTFPMDPREEPLYAVGQESIPLLLGHAWWFRLTPGPPKDGALPFEGTVDHFFEFLNSGTKDFTAPEGMTLNIKGRPDLQGNNVRVELPDLIIPLEGVVFPAGQVTIISTTNLSSAEQEAVIADSALFRAIELPEDERKVSGQIQGSDHGEGKENLNRYRLGLAREGTPRDRDFGTFVEWGAGENLFGYFPFIDLQDQREDQPFPFELAWEGEGTEPISRLFASRLDGSLPPRFTGDPRGLLSQQEYSFPPVSGGTGDAGLAQPHTPFVPFPMGQPLVRKGEGARLGDLLTDQWRRDHWPDDSQLFTGQAGASPGVILDRPFRHAGELRVVYDPRFSASQELNQERSGGRSLRIGRPESLISEKRFSSGWRQASWRLADALGAEIQNRPLLSPQSSGEININGVLRDHGAAVRAALRSAQFTSDPILASQRAGQVLTTQEEEVILDGLQQFIRDHGLFLERGEISEILIEPTENGSETDSMNDRTREELLADIIPLITTRSFSFRISAVGQVYRRLSNGAIEVEAESSVVAIYGLRPIFGEGDDPQVQSYETACLYKFPAE